MLASLALVAAFTPAPQFSLRSDAVFDLGVDAIVEARRLAHTPGGGVAIAGGIRPGGVNGINSEGFAARFDADGRELWRDVFALYQGPPVTSAGVADGLAVLDDGAVAAAYSAAPLSSSVLLRVYEENGSLRWQMELATPAPFTDAKVGALGAVDGHDLLLHLEWRGATGGDPARAVSLRVDGSTGAEEWRQERAIRTPANPLLDVRGGARDGALHFVHRLQDLSFVAYRISGDGTVEYETPGVLPDTVSTFSNLTRLFHVGSDGQVLAGTADELVLLDALGDVAANVAVPNLRGARRAPNGDVHVLTGFDEARAYSASGDPLWQRGGLSVTRALVPTQTNGALVLRANGTSTQASQTALDAAGAVLGDYDLVATDPLRTGFASTDVDARGGAWVAMSYQSLDITAPVEDTFVRLFRTQPDDVDVSELCSAGAPNSAGKFGRIAAVGDGDAADDDVVLFADRLPPLQTVLFLNSRTPAAPPGLAVGEGTLCLGGTINRYVQPGEIQTATTLGAAWLRLSLPNTPDGSVVSPVLAGETLYYHAWHRDVVGGAQTSNLTGAVAVTYR